jgi:uncharacterized protein
MILFSKQTSLRFVIMATLLLSSPMRAQTQSDDVANLDIAESAFDEQDYDAAFKIWQPMADAGNMDAQMALANAALFCDCVEKSTNMAFKYYRMAAQKGNVEAIRKMGWIYATAGADKNEAAVYYKTAADMGDVESQMELGDLYRDGIGGAATLAQMPKYYLMAAAQGDRAGYQRMGYLYASGKQVPADPVKSYIAYSMATALSFPMAKLDAAKAEKKLTAKQLIKAKALAAKCVQAKYLKCL